MSVRQTVRTINHNLTADGFMKEFNGLQTRIAKSSRIASSKDDRLMNIETVNSNSVFANNNCSLNGITAYGFDYDHTLANYAKISGNIIYSNALSYLVSNLNYPSELLKYEYNPEWAIRGLQFDRLTGNVMKLNQFMKLNSRTIYNGHSPVMHDTINKHYGGYRVSEEYFSKNFRDLSDLFGVPETCLYSDVIEFLKSKKYDFEVSYVADDIRRALNYIHDGGIFHNAIANEPMKYVQKLPNLSEYIRSLKENNKKIFLLTNSSYNYIYKCCDFIFEDVCQDLGLKHWTEVFDWTIANAKKPNWFSSVNNFRKFNQFVSVDAFEDNSIYTGGSLQEFHRLTGLRNDEVMYFGDNIGADLIGPRATGQWKTVAIIKELEREINLNNTEGFRKSLDDVLDIENLWFQSQHLRDDNVRTLMLELSDQRSDLRNEIKEKYNKQFGSIFRTHATRTLFFHRLARYSDLYASKVTNMLEFPIDYKFGCRRQIYEHEPVLM